MILRMETIERRNMEIIKLIWRKRSLLIMVAIVTAALSIITTYILSPKYKSISRVYPANLQLFSDESPTEQLLQWMKSNELKRLFMNNPGFDLINRYDIDTSAPHKETYFSLYFDENFEVQTTEYQSVEITVTDKDPEMAQNLNRSFITFTDSLIRKAHNEKLLEFVGMYEKAMNNQLHRIDSMKLILNGMAEKYAITDYKIQLNSANKYYIKQLSKGKEVAELKNMLDKLGQKGPDQYLALRLIETEIDNYNGLKTEYENKLKDLNKRFTYSVIVQQPNLPDSKYWPKRGLITIVSVLATLSLCIILLVFSEKRNNPA